MKKSYLGLVIVGVAMSALTALAQNALAQGTPSSKATAAINTAVGCTFKTAGNVLDTLPQTCHDIFSGAALTVDPDNFVTVMNTTIKVSNSQSLFVSPSLVTALYTRTSTSTSPKNTSTAIAEGGIFLRAIVTNQATGAVQVGYPVAACDPNSVILGCQLVGGKFGVTLDARVQTLTQTISDCVVNVVVGGVAGSGTCDFTSTIDLILKTTSAHTFNFIFPNVGVGVYTVEIQAAVNADASALGLSVGTGAVGGAAYGLGSLTVESVRLVHDFDF
jgi:hypothetical protein